MGAKKPVGVLIEDNPSIRRVLRAGLASRGFEVPLLSLLALLIALANFTIFLELFT